MSDAGPAYDYRAARDAVFGSALPGPLRLLVLALIEFMPNCKPSIATLSARCGVERKTAMRALARLERMGVISVERAMGQCSRYDMQPVPSWRTGTKRVLVPEEDGTGTKDDLGPVPNRDGTGTKPVPKAVLSSFRKPFEAVRAEHRQFPVGWHWTPETEAAARMQTVTTDELQEHVNYWTTHAWSVPVTDLDGELRRSIGGIRRRRETAAGKTFGKGRALPEQDSGWDWRSLDQRHRTFCVDHDLGDPSGLAHAFYRTGATTGLTRPQADKAFAQHLRGLTKPRRETKREATA